jgi:hypothetical protein
MKKIFLIIILLGIRGFCFSQNFYPIQTILKGDSVVIYTLEQSQDINLMIQNQKSLNVSYKSKYEHYLGKTDSLEKIVAAQLYLIDSLRLVQKNQDSLEKKLHTIESWLVKASIDNSYLYMSWQDSKIKSVDLTLYTVHCSMQTGTIRMVRRGPNDEFYTWKGINHTRRESPSINWELKYPEEDRPIVNNLPVDIKISQYVR